MRLVCDEDEDGWYGSISGVWERLVSPGFGDRLSGRRERLLMMMAGWDPRIEAVFRIRLSSKRCNACIVCRYLSRSTTASSAAESLCCNLL